MKEVHTVTKACFTAQLFYRSWTRHI